MSPFFKNGDIETSQTLAYLMLNKFAIALSINLSEILFTQLALTKESLLPLVCQKIL